MTNKLTAPTKVLLEIILLGIHYHPDEGYTEKQVYALNEEEVIPFYEEAKEALNLGECKYELRDCGEDSGLACENSQHYESTAIAYECYDGTWVGWTYWYGGGKHANPEELEWIKDAYYLNCEEIVTTKNVFTRKEINDKP
jgi:hypothetical protein